jgi:hypothetical protein
MPTIAQWAIGYRRLGWSVFPIVPGHKFPPGGFRLKRCFDNLLEESEILSWWEKNPGYNIGLATGKVSGVDCLDFDGSGALDIYEASIGGFSETITQSTGRTDGGFHALYKYHGGGLKSKKYLEEDGHGIDLKTDGGIIVLSPSVHKSGKRYQWRINPLTDGLEDLADFPDDAKSFFAKQNTDIKKINPSELHSKGIPDGLKHHDGFRYACRLRALGLCFDEAIVLMEHVFSVCDPPPKDGVKKAAFDRVTQAYSKFEPGIRQEDDPRNGKKICVRPIRC